MTHSQYALKAIINAAPHFQTDVRIDFIDNRLVIIPLKKMTIQDAIESGCFGLEPDDTFYVDGEKNDIRIRCRSYDELYSDYKNLKAFGLTTLVYPKKEIIEAVYEVNSFGDEEVHFKI